MTAFYPLSVSREDPDRIFDALGQHHEKLYKMSNSYNEVDDA